MSQPSAISARKLPKSSLKKLLGYGDIGRIAARTHYHYQHVSRVIRDETDNDMIWTEVAKYIDSLPSVELSDRAVKLLAQIHEEAKHEAA
jgi:hypothetical protein